jgi:hypothetical protein
MKLINFRKIGTVLAIAAFGFISFTAGVNLTQNANSAGSSSVLPVVKGGTGQNSLANVTVGNAAKLATARYINDVAFNGTESISVPGYFIRVNAPNEAPDDQCLYIKISGLSASTAIILELSLNTNPGFLADIYFSSKQLLTTLRKDMYTNIAKGSNNYSDLSYRIIAQKDNSNVRDLYIKATKFVTGRQILWKPPFAGVKLNFITAADEINEINDGTWYQFNIVQDSSVETPVPTPTPTTS